MSALRVEEGVLGGGRRGVWKVERDVVGGEGDVAEAKGIGRVEGDKVGGGR